MRLTKKDKTYGSTIYVPAVNLGFVHLDNQNYLTEMLNKIGQLEDVEDELGIDLITFLKGINPNTCFMEITKDKEFYFCGDAYYGNYSKEALLKLIQNLLFMYWALAKKELLK